MPSSLMFFVTVFLQAIPDKSWLDYGVAGALVILLIVLVKLFAWLTAKENKERDMRYAEAIKDLKDVLIKVDQNYSAAIDKFVKANSEANDKFINANREAIDRFISAMNKQMESNSYNSKVLLELKNQIEKAMLNDSNDFGKFKSDIINILQKMGLEYNLSKK